MSESDAPRGHFALFGFPVRIHPFFWVIAVMFGASGLGASWTTEALVRIGIWVGVLFVSILWHELGHAFAMRRYGYSPFIVLHGMGGATAWGAGPARPSPKVRVVVSLAGPFFGFLLGGVVALAWWLSPPVSHWALLELFQLMVGVNLIWGACNLVPMVPWDGGHALHGALDHFTGGKGLKPTAIITIVTAVAIAGLILLHAPGYWWPLFLCGISVVLAVRMLRGPRAPAAVMTKAAPSADPLRAIGEARAMLEQAGDPVQLTHAILWKADAPQWLEVARNLSDRIAPRTHSPSQRAIALELAAWAYLLGGEPRSAQTAVTGMRPTHDPSPILAALVAARTGRTEVALAAAREMDELHARRRIEAWSLVSLGRYDEALEAVAEDREAGAFVDATIFAEGAYDAAAELGARLFERFGQADDAYNTACSHARGGRPSEGLAWLERAVDAGYDDVAHLEGDEDLAAVRALPEYGDLRAKLPT
ncbi:MAG: hypothetical protein KC619_10850 [Myxococcales bacterium]|nr:hypothetical protein [Myxococcales bacterium]